jgi:hypothetical protein
MFGPAPRFPAFEAWQNMSEGEQDSLLARMEAARRRKTLVLRMALALAGAAAAAGLIAALQVWGGIPV